MDRDIMKFRKLMGRTKNLQHGTFINFLLVLWNLVIQWKPALEQPLFNNGGK